jgi:trigger factor
MEIQVQEIEPCKLTVIYNASALEVLDKKAVVIQAFKKAPVPGFRKGKATLEALSYHYKDQIQDALKRALAEDAYHNTLFEKKYKPHGSPYFKSYMIHEGKFTCTFDMAVKPEFELAPYKNLEIVKPHEKSAINEAERLLQELRVRFGTTESFKEDDFVQENDDLVVDYEAFIDSEKIDSLSAQSEILTAGKNLLPDFDSNLYGMKLKETKEFNIKAPEDGLPSFAGKTISFKLTLNQANKKTPLPLNDELAIKLGRKDLEELKTHAHNQAAQMIVEQTKSQLQNNFCEKLVESNTINVPEWMSISEAKYLAHNSKLEWDKCPNEDKEKFISLANRNVKLSLILEKIREVEPEAQLSEQEVFEIVKQSMLKTKPDCNVMEELQRINQTGQLQYLMVKIRDEYALDACLKYAKIIE